MISSGWFLGPASLQFLQNWRRVAGEQYVHACGRIAPAQLLVHRLVCACVLLVYTYRRYFSAHFSDFIRMTFLFHYGGTCLESDTIVLQVCLCAARNAC
jgi:hypothetical protein